MTDADALLRTILAHPMGDHPRLVFADYLDESGDPIDAARAEFIRCSLGEAGGDTAAKACGNSLRLKARAAELLEEHEANWLVDWPGWEIGWQANSTWVPEAHWMWDRGFVSRVEMPVAALVGGECSACRGLAGNWHELTGSIASSCVTCKGTGRVEGIAKRLFESQPVTTVTLSDREPGRYGNTREWYWVRWTEDVTYPLHTLPEEIFDRMAGEPQTNQLGTVVKHYATLELAIAALSDAAVAYGRELAGLPQLKGEA